MTTSELALAELVATAAYGKLAGLGVTGAMIPQSPDIDAAERLGELAANELDAWRVLRAHLGTLTDLPQSLLERHRPLFDEFFDGATEHGWEHACAALAFSWSIANDFLTMIAPRLPGETQAVFEEVTANRAVERFALEQLQHTVRTDEDRDRMQELVARLHGKALAGFQHAMRESDALEVLLDATTEPGVASREFAIAILSRHRARMAALGIDDPD